MKEYILSLKNDKWKHEFLEATSIGFTPKLQLMKTFNLNHLLLVSLLDVIVMMLRCHFPYVTQLIEIILKPKGMLYNAMSLWRPNTTIEPI